MTLTAERSEMVVALCQSLIQRQSYSGREDAVVERMKQAFKELKNDLSIRPIYHQLETRIEAHIFIAFLVVYSSR